MEQEQTYVTYSPAILSNTNFILAAAPPEPKRFTDEELKQRYGIHLATRLQSDDPGKEKNWADIDDDDDDWAPETIEWTDGTKITLPQADETPVPAPEPTPEPVAISKDVKSVEEPKSNSPAPVQSASPTVKPSGFGSGRAGLVLKGAAEKPTLVAKPPGPPTPVKSPWASLPPVDKVAPVAIEIPQNQAPPSRFGQRDPHGFQAMPPPPAKEIAADDFSRSWRDGNANPSRELYNSQSGRYEPVNDSRRGSTRNDARQPAVLQRPHQDGPAEPSAAFQTHRAGGQDPSFSRRRTSSNVSGGSGNFIRRMSRGASGHEMPPPHEMLSLRRGSLAAVSDAPSSPRPFSPSGQQQNRGPATQHQQWQSRASPVVSHPSPQSTHGQLAPSVPESVDGPSAPRFNGPDIVEAQSQKMKLAREAAIKRRQEEAKEEAAKRERIRIKLEAMGPLPEKPSKATTPKQDKAVPVQIQARQQQAVTEPAQAPVAEKSADEAKVTPTEPPHEPPPTSTADAKPEKPTSEPRTNGINHEPKLSTGSRQGPQETRPQPWQSSSSERYQAAQNQGPWAPPPQQSASRSVWGPPTNDRTLGNGTFNPELSRVPNLHTSQHPGPIGPPNQNRGNNNQFSQGRRDPFVSRPAPIGPPSRHVDSHMEEQRRMVAGTGWALAAEKVQHDDSLLRQKQEAEAAERKELEAQGLLPDIHTTYKETWRAVAVTEQGDRTKQAGVEANVPAVKSNADAIGNAPPQFGDAWRTAPNNNPSPRVRDSRFFPNNRDARLEEQPMPFDRPGSPSPPPPTMAGHPAYDGDSARPLVSLPKPAPVVKLPPPTVLAPIGPPKPASFAAAVAVPLQHGPAHPPRQDYTSRAASSHQDVRRQPETGAGGWQDRINSLIGRKGTGNSPPKSSHALAVDSSSKNALELPRSQSAATVSLPSLSAGVLVPDNGSTMSKPAAEECFEEQEMGSLPPIKLPSQAPAAAWSPAQQPPKSIPKKFQAAEVVSMEPIDFPDSVLHNRFTLRVHLPGEAEKIVTGAFAPRQRSNPRRGGARGRGAPQQASSPNVRGGRGKENFSSPKSENSTISPNPHYTSRGSHRGGGRGYGNNWNRHISTPVQT